ncbi:hypothetical protein ACHAO7_010399 [Fusarium culmorum]
MKTNFLALIGLLAIPSSGEIMDPLPEAASRKELRFQPYLDYDMDGCYNTAAINEDGRINSGLKKGFSVHEYCRDKQHLLHSNAYSRKRCNHGYCAIMYDYYFEKDQAAALSGHRHDWENIVVFLKGDKVVRVAATEEHTKYRYSRNCMPDKFCDIPSNGRHPKLVYHKVHGDLHSFRFAKMEDGETELEEPENPLGRWFKSPLVGWDYWPSDELRDTLVNWPDKMVKPSIGDKKFGRALEKAAGSGRMVPGFDPYQEKDDEDEDEDED